MDRGFTAIDLMATLLLVVVVAGLSVAPLRQSIDRYRISSEARRIATELQRARSLAQTKGSIFQVTIDSNSGSLQVTDLADASNQRAQLKLRHGTTFESTPSNTLRLYPKGYARGGDIVLASPDGHRARVSLLASGRTQVDVEDDVLEEVAEKAQEGGGQ